jgi:hypothetical protein
MRGKCWPEIARVRPREEAMIGFLDHLAGVY